MLIKPSIFVLILVSSVVVSVDSCEKHNEEDENSYLRAPRRAQLYNKPPLPEFFQDYMRCFFDDSSEIVRWAVCCERNGNEYGRFCRIWRCQVPQVLSCRLPPISCKPLDDRWDTAPGALRPFIRVTDATGPTVSSSKGFNKDLIMNFYQDQGLEESSESEESPYAKKSIKSLKRAARQRGQPRKIRDVGDSDIGDGMDRPKRRPKMIPRRSLRPAAEKKKPKEKDLLKYYAVEEGKKKIWLRPNNMDPHYPPDDDEDYENADSTTPSPGKPEGEDEDDKGGENNPDDEDDVDDDIDAHNKRPMTLEGPGVDSEKQEPRKMYPKKDLEKLVRRMREEKWRRILAPQRYR